MFIQNVAAFCYATSFWNPLLLIFILLILYLLQVRCREPGHLLVFILYQPPPWADSRALSCTYQMLTLTEMCLLTSFVLDEYVQLLLGTRLERFVLGVFGLVGRHTSVRLCDERPGHGPAATMASVAPDLVLWGHDHDAGANPCQRNVSRLQFFLACLTCFAAGKITQLIFVTHHIKLVKMHSDTWIILISALPEICLDLSCSSRLFFKQCIQMICW